MGTGYGRMTDEKPSAEIIQGPWKGLRKVVIPDVEETRKIQEDIMFANELTEEILVQIVHALSENGIKIDDDGFIRNLGFLVETLKATIYKDMKLKHEMNDLIDLVTVVTKNEEKQTESSLDLDIIEELVGSIDNDDDEVS